jgi:MbtH protein
MGLSSVDHEISASHDALTTPDARPRFPGGLPVSEIVDSESYVVVQNHEEQYSIWWAGRELPAGWRVAGKTGTKEECLAYIEEVWTDMRPLSLRRWMEQHGE